MISGKGILINEAAAANKTGRGRPKQRSLSESAKAGQLRPSAAKSKAEIFDNLHGFLTYTELSEFLKISERTLRQYVSEGRIPAKRIPGTRKIRFSKAEIAAWLTN